MKAPELIVAELKFDKLDVGEPKMVKPRLAELKLAELKLVEIDERISELRKMKAALQQVTEACLGGEASALHCTILNALEH